MIFFEDDISFSLNTTPLKSEMELTSGLWLTLVGINETPPHIALINDGKYYSLSTRKVDCGSPLDRFMHVINRKHRPILFIQIETNSVIARNEAISANSLLDTIYKGLHALNNAEKTCLSPIKEFFATSYLNEFTEVNYVFELLALAEKKSLLKESVSLFCDATNTNIVTLPKYNMAQIKNRIRELSSQTLNHTS